MEYLTGLAMAVVIVGHFLFAYLQWFRWRQVCKRLTDFTPDEAIKAAFLGRSVASYNAAIAVGLLLSFLLAHDTQLYVQGVVLALIVLTAVVGATGTRGNAILIARLLPAAAALLLLLLSR